MTARAWLAVVLLPSLAAADTIPLSALPTGGRVDTGPSVRVPRGVAFSNNEDIASESGCLVPYIQDDWLSGTDDLGASWRQSSVSKSSETFGVERLEHRGGAVVLERTRLKLEGGKLVATDRGRIELRPVADLDGVVVYAFRRGDVVYLVAPVGGDSTVRIDTEVSDGGTHNASCFLVSTQLRVVRGSSQAVRMGGAVPGTPTARYLVDASVSKTSRDREPLLAITARRL